MQKSKSNIRVFIDVMSIIIGFCIVVTAVWHLSAGNAHKANRANEYSKEYQDNTRERIALECTNTELIEIQKCVDEIINANRDAERSENDLTAQESMADWAFWMLIVTIAMFGATVAGVVFVWGTLIETRKVGQAQTRAYISIVEADDIIVDVGRPIQLKVAIQNLGQTPAKEVSYVAQPHVAKTEDINKIGNPDLRILSNGSDLASGVPFILSNKTTNFYLSNKHIDSINSGLFSLVVVYYIRYRDVIP